MSIIVAAPSAARDPVLFAPAVILGEGAQWRFVPQIADMNHDGRPDIVVTHRKPVNRNALHLWIQQETGIFEGARQDWQNPQYAAVAVGDIDSDGNPDVLTAGHFNTFGTFLGDGHGGLKSSVDKRESGFAGAAVADLDGDQQLEAVVLSDDGGGIEIHERDNAAGKWTLLTRLWEGNIGRDMVVADLNRDDKPDIAAVGVNEGLVVYLNNGREQWERRALSQAGEIYQSIAVGDVNGDGLPDIVVNGGMQSADEKSGPDAYLADGKGGWLKTSEGLQRLVIPSSGVAVVDVDGDGNGEIIAGGNQTEEIGMTDFGLFVFDLGGDGTWSLLDTSGLPAQGLARPRGIMTGDLNGDGKIDLVVTHETSDLQTGEGGYLSLWYGI